MLDPCAPLGRSCLLQVYALLCSLSEVCMLAGARPELEAQTTSLWTRFFSLCRSNMQVYEHIFQSMLKGAQIGGDRS